jgi:hypothetical protein
MDRMIIFVAKFLVFMNGAALNIQRKQKLNKHKKN